MGGFGEGQLLRADLVAAGAAERGRRCFSGSGRGRTPVAVGRLRRAPRSCAARGSAAAGGHHQDSEDGRDHLADECAAGCASSGWPPIPLMNGIWSRAGDVPLSPAWRHLRCARLAGRVNLGREHRFDTGVAWRSPRAAQAAGAVRDPGRRGERRLEPDRPSGAVRRGPRHPLGGAVIETSAAAGRSAPVLRSGIRDQAPLAAGRRRARRGRAGGARLVTVLDQGYPANLRLIPNLPPFLFYRGDAGDADARSVAVVGTRQAPDRAPPRRPNVPAARRA